MHLHEKYVGEYRGMFTEHVAIKRAVKTAKGNAKAEGHRTSQRLLTLSCTTQESKRKPCTLPR